MPTSPIAKAIYIAKLLILQILFCQKKLSEREIQLDDNQTAWNELTCKTKMFIWFEQLSVIVISHMCACFFYLLLSAFSNIKWVCSVFSSSSLPRFFLMTKRCLRINIYIHTYFASRFSWSSSSSTTNNEYTRGERKGKHPKVICMYISRYLEIITSEGFFFFLTCLWPSFRRR